MFKIFTPFAHAKTVYEIDVNFYIKNNISCVFCDLDNTLDAYNVFSPRKEAFELKQNLEKHGIKLYILSNNHNKRVNDYAKELGVECLSMARKPFKGKVNKYIRTLQIDKNNVIIIGDQTVTDIQCANRVKVKSVLVDKLVKIDQPTTRFNRFFDKRIRKYLEKHGKLIDWRTYL